MKWIKKGLIFKPDSNFGWMNSHAQVPTALLLNDRIRVYFATRPKQNLSLTTYLDLDIHDLNNIIQINEKPILELGHTGAFDEHGIMPSSVIYHNGLVFLYYSGWQRCLSVPYNNYTGLAISEDGGTTFRKYSPGPIIDRKPFEIYSATSPFVFIKNKIWHMWYSSGIEWMEINGKLEHCYDIKYAMSYDGIKWEQTGMVAIPQKNIGEAITKPTIIELNEKYYMWYSYRGSSDFRGGFDSYRIGLAESRDLESWIRKDEKSGIDISEIGFDSEMIAYPNVILLNEKYILFYNGNNFGYDGILLAKLKQ